MRRGPLVSLASGLWALWLILGSSPAAGAQGRGFTGYVQSVPVWSDETPLRESNLADVSRFRVMADRDLGPVAIGAAYEHIATVRRRALPAGTGVGAVPGGGEWLDLGWTIGENTHAVWRHRFDRLRLSWSPTGAVQLIAGRQAVSWGTTLLLTPADPFIPFDPADPFREFRAGVDAVRARIYPGPLSEIDIVVRGTKTQAGEELTMLARGMTTWRNWELSAWGGGVYGDAALAVGAAGSVGAWAVRGEAVVRKEGSASVFRGTIGLDHLVQVNGRDLYLIAEYQRDGFGAASAEQYPAVLTSEPFSRGEQQVLGRDETVVQASYQIHPLWSLSGLWIWNLNDRSALVSPGFAYSAGNNASIGGGFFLGIGEDEATPARPLPSEFGPAGKTGFLSLSLFF